MGRKPKTERLKRALAARHVPGTFRVLRADGSWADVCPRTGEILAGTGPRPRKGPEALKSKEKRPQDGS